MCTSMAVTCDGCLYFGRNMDLHYDFPARITRVKRGERLIFKTLGEVCAELDFFGMGVTEGGFPLLADGVNSRGLCAAALNFPKSAYYLPEKALGKRGVRSNGARSCESNKQDKGDAQGIAEKPCESQNESQRAKNESHRIFLAPYELIPWALGRFSTAAELKRALSLVTLVDIPFSESIGTSPLHFHFADKDESITVEPLAQGLTVTPNPYGVLTNEPPFDYHLTSMELYSHLTPRSVTGEEIAESGKKSARVADNALKTENARNAECKQGTISEQGSEITEDKQAAKAEEKAKAQEVSPLSLGLGAVGLPGDYSSPSRFVKLAFLKKYAVLGDTEEERFSALFSLMSSVAPPRGAVLTPEGAPHFTVYTAVINAATSEYRYITYDRTGAAARSAHNVCIANS